MLRKIDHKIRATERRLRFDYGKDISTPAARRQAWWHFQLTDHNFARALWANFHRVDEGVYRANQPSPRRLRIYRDRGIRTILNLRGPSDYSHYLFEREACTELGLELIDHGIYARSLASRDELLGLLDIFERIDRPFLMHCKSGADRTGLASALWLMHMRGVPIEQARAQLHWRYLHLKGTKTGILDRFLDRYAEARARRTISIRDWIAQDYDRDAITAEFAALRAGHAPGPAALPPAREREQDRDDADSSNHGSLPR